MNPIRTISIAVLVCVAPATLCASDSNSGAASAKAAKPAKAVEATGKDLEKQMLGATLVADVTLAHIDRFRTLGMREGFGKDQPVCDFIATEKWVSKHGTSIKKGETIKIGKATVIEATDGFGNTGTKLILDSAEPKEGLVFYCYAYNSGEKAYWAIEKPKIKKALAGVFRIQE